MATIKIFKLTTGDDILGEVVDSADGANITLKNIVQLVFVPQKAGEQPQLGFGAYPQYSMTKSTVIDLNVINIVFSTQPDPQLLEQYNQIFGNIIAPTSKIVLK